MSQTLKEFQDASPERKREILGTLAELLDRNNIPIEDIGQINRINVWQGMSKDSEGTAQVTDMVGIQLVPTWDSGPQWPVIQPAKPTVVKAPKLSTIKDDGYKRAITLPDMQIGFWVDDQDKIHPTHDDAALDLALQLVRYVRPHQVFLHGDNCDLPEMSSKFRLSPAFARTTQATLDRTGLFCAELRAAAGDECKIVWLEGNHEFRLSSYIIDNAKAAFGIRQANAPSGWPVLSIPHLCHLDQHGIEYLSGYPANEAWINQRFRVIHGHQVASNSSTAHKYLAHERTSVAFGHVHRREWAERTRQTYDGPRTICAISPGCLCLTNGGVPSTKGGIDVRGNPVASVEDWQNGILVVRYEDGDGRFIPEQVPIIDGWTLYHGKEFTANPTG